MPLLPDAACSFYDRRTPQITVTGLICSSYYVLVVTVTAHVYTTQSLAHVDTHVVRRTTLSFGFTITSMFSMTQLTWCLAAIVGPRRSKTVSPVVLSTTDGRMTTCRPKAVVARASTIKCHRGLRHALNLTVR